MRNVLILRIFTLIMIFLGLTYSFVTNGFGVAPWVDWSIWEQSSEAMVLQRIEADLLERKAPQLGLATYGVGDTSVFDRLSAEGIATLSTTAPTDFVPYESEIGGQAHFWSFVWRNLGCSSISCMHLASSAITAFFVIALFVGLILIGSAGLGWAWLISIAASPWITYTARNLFWSPGLYFLPSVAAIGLILAQTRKWRFVAAVGVFVAFMIKYVGTGYHEFTAFTMLAAAIPIIAIIFGSPYGLNKRRQWMNSFYILASSAIAMILTLMIHAFMMTGNVFTGIRLIWVNTILRRTYGDASNYDPTFTSSLEANPIEVIWKYIWSEWTTDVLSFSINKSGSVFSVSLGSISFIVLIFLALGIVGFRLRFGDHRWKRDAALLAMGFAIPVTWFLAAKGYSYIHTNLLFFLWYFLFVPSLIYIVAGFFWTERHLSARRLRYLADVMGFGSRPTYNDGGSVLRGER